MDAAVTALHLPGNSAVNAICRPTIRPTRVDSVARVASSSHASALLVDQSDTLRLTRFPCISRLASPTRRTAFEVSGPCSATVTLSEAWAILWRRQPAVVPTAGLGRLWV